jgi:outer membrane protein OmpA-like peptidoglycan-associated protein
LAPVRLDEPGFEIAAPGAPRQSKARGGVAQEDNRKKHQETHMKRISTRLSFSLPLAMLLLLPAASVVAGQSDSIPTIVETREILTFGLPDNDEVKVKFKGTNRIPDADGEAKVKSKDGMTQIRLKLKDMKPAVLFGGDFNTYVLWVITPEGHLQNLAELVLKKDRVDVTATTPLAHLGMFVTAEPHFLVRQPSRLIVLETEKPDDKNVKDFRVATVRFEGNRGLYNFTRDTLAGAPEIRRDIDHDLNQARAAVRLAERTGAGSFAAADLQSAREALSRAEEIAATDKKKDRTIAASREAVRLAAKAEGLAEERFYQAQLEEQRARNVEEIERLRAAATQAESDAERARLEAEQQRLQASMEQQARQQVIERVEQLQSETQRAREEAQTARAEAQQARSQAEEMQRQIEQREQLSQAEERGRQQGVSETLSALERANREADQARAEADQRRAELEREQALRNQAVDQAQRALQEAEQTTRRLEQQREELESGQQDQEEMINREIQSAQRSVEQANAELQEARAEAERNRSRLAEAEREAQEARELAEERTRELNAERQAREQAVAELESTRQEYRQHQEELQRARAEQQERDRELREALNQVAETRETVEGLIVNLPDILFEVNSAELKPQSVEVLSKVAHALRNAGTYRISVEGHTDSVGNAEYNRELSEQRAEAVRSFLVDLGMDEALIVDVRGAGESEPVASNETDEGRQRNRRVEILVHSDEQAPASERAE